MRDGGKDLTVDPERRRGTPEVGVLQGTKTPFLLRGSRNLQPHVLLATPTEVLLCAGNNRDFTSSEPCGSAKKLSVWTDAFARINCPLPEKQETLMNAGVPKYRPRFPTSGPTAKPQSWHGQFPNTLPIRRTKNVMQLDITMNDISCAC